ncbi:MAG: hypothetical protein AABZ33_02005 [Chloroflexota bacterium]
MAEFDAQTGSDGTLDEAPTAIAEAERPDEAERPLADANADADGDEGEDGAEVMSAEVMSAEVMSAEVMSAEDPAQPNYQAALLVDLARAMHDAADVRHERALETVDRLRTAQVQQISERGVSEAEAARDQADRDIAAIHDWAEGEIERIHTERERRNQARRRELKALLDRFDTQTEWEIGAIEAAVADHRADLATFFTRLRGETDVSVIARVAQDAPQLPELDDVTAAARARAAAAGSMVGSARSSEEQDVSDPPKAEETSLDDAPGIDASDADDQPLVGVMDLSGAAAVQDPWSFERPIEATGDGSAASEIGAGAETVEPRSIEVSGAPIEAIAPRSTSTGLLQAIPALRPVASWLNHTNGDSDKTT